jgi:hypothetical protein
MLGMEDGAGKEQNMDPDFKALMLQPSDQRWLGKYSGGLDRADGTLAISAYPSTIRDRGAVGRPIRRWGLAVNAEQRHARPRSTATVRLTAASGRVRPQAASRLACRSSEANGNELVGEPHARNPVDVR